MTFSKKIFIYFAIWPTKQKVQVQVYLIYHTQYKLKKKTGTL